MPTVKRQPFSLRAVVEKTYNNESQETIHSIYMAILKRISRGVPLYEALLKPIAGYKK